MTAALNTSAQPRLLRALLAGIAALVAAVALMGAAPSQASAKPSLGIGDQHPSMFFDARFSWLGVKQARLVVAWDWERRRADKKGMDDWFARARAFGVEPFVQFGRSWERRYRYDTPSVARYRSMVRRFRARYPDIRVFSPWNEVNHCSQPTCKSPKLAAQYYNAVRDVCDGDCTIVAADLIDQHDFIGWVKRFRRYAKGKPRIWGLHNYLDTNYFRTRGTKRVLRALPGEVWFTEVAGIVKRDIKRKEPFNEGIRHQTKATRYVLYKLTKLSKRIKRVYLYDYNVVNRAEYWDSALIDHRGRSRPAFDVVARWLGLDPKKAPGKRGGRAS